VGVDAPESGSASGLHLVDRPGVGDCGAGGRLGGLPCAALAVLQAEGEHVSFWRDVADREGVAEDARAGHGRFGGHEPEIAGLGEGLDGKAGRVRGLGDRGSGSEGEAGGDANEGHGPCGTCWPSPATGAAAKPAQGVDSA